MVEEEASVEEEDQDELSLLNEEQPKKKEVITEADKLSLNKSFTPTFHLECKACGETVDKDDLISHIEKDSHVLNYVFNFVTQLDVKTGAPKIVYMVKSDFAKGYLITFTKRTEAMAYIKKLHPLILFNLVVDL